MLRRGEAYKGPAMLFGKSFMTAYFPIMNPAGKVIGILYVGTAMAELDAMLTHVADLYCHGTGKQLLPRTIPLISDGRLRVGVPHAYERCAEKQIPYTPPTENREPPVSISDLAR